MMSDPVEGKVSPYAPATRLGSQVNFGYLPETDRERAEAYTKYDQLYWNDDEAYSLRLLQDEEGTRIPNPRTVVDTTAHFFLKGLKVSPKDPEKPLITNPSSSVDPDRSSDDEEDKPQADGQKLLKKRQEARNQSSMGDALKAFLDREMFYSRFQNAKHAGVARGDFAFHMTGDPEAVAGKRLSLTPVQPWKVILDEDPDDSAQVTQVRLVDRIPHPTERDKMAVQELRYWYEDKPNGSRSVWRAQYIWSLEKPWYDIEERQLISTALEPTELPEPIDTIPVYMFHNINWDSARYGTSELRGFEKTVQSISQVASDQSTALGLEGLGVYATDGGAPVDGTGKEIDWEVAPGKVMEVVSGSYFRRVEGVGSVKPTMDHIEYLESKIREAGGLSDVALGRVDVQTAQSGIALAIKFMPTLAKLEERDEAALGKLKQMFYDWKSWHAAYEDQVFEDEIVVTIGDKLPSNRTERVNELNNMLDRGVISRRYYRSEMQNLGYVFPENMEEEIQEEAEMEAERKALLAPPGLKDNAEAAANGSMDPPPSPNQPGVKTQKDKKPNRSNNAGKTNESSGTEATQSVQSQARGGKPLAHAQ